MRIAIYCRVSTDEQKKHGISIDAQLSSLREWAKSNNHTIIGEYIDAGISGKKPYTKRPALSRFMYDLENGLSVDALVFTKLDRFYRSVRLYYQAIDIMDKHKVAWQATQEDYETVTASGRFKVNIMLAVAEDEADRTSERIKAVFDHKVQKGEAITCALPLGLKIENKRIVPDENADAVRAFFHHYQTHGNKSRAQRFLQTEYGISLPTTSITHMLKNPLYKGQYRDNPNYCEAIIPPDEFDAVQHDLERRYTRSTPSGTIYLFSGLLICAECGKRLTAARHSAKQKHREYYRCPTHFMRHECPHSKITIEYKLESFLITHIEKELEGQEFAYHKQNPSPRKKPDKRAIERKLDRLKDLYLDELITKDQYKADREKLLAQLNADPSTQKSFDKLKKLLGDNFHNNYTSFTREQKKTFWRGIIDHITIDADGIASIYFK